MSLKKILLFTATFAVCILMVVLVIKSSNQRIDSTQTSSKYSIPRQIQYSYTIYNTTNKLLENADLWVLAPVKQTATQRCNQIEASFPYELNTDKLGNQILHFSFLNFPPHSTKILIIKANLMLSESPNQMEIKNSDNYLLPAEYIEADNPQIKLIANKLKTSIPIHTSRNIYNWIAENIQYSGYRGNDLGARYAL